MSFLFKSKLFLPIAIAAVVIMLFSIIYALIPKGDDTSSISGDETAQQKEENDGANTPGEEGIEAEEESAPVTTDPENQYYTDDQAEAAGYEHDADPASESDEDSGQSAPSNPWVDNCPSDSVPVGNSCRCDNGLVGAPGSCKTPEAPIITTPPVGITLKSSQPFSPAKVYTLNVNTKVRNVPDASDAGPTVYNKGTKFDIVELQEYSNGKKFLLTKDQKSHGSKFGFEFSTLTVPAAAPPAGTPSTNKMAVSKVLVFMMENKKYAVAKANMPYTMKLANQTGLVYTNSWSAGEWKSLPNYIAMAGGSNFGVVSDSAKPIAGPSIFGLAVNNGKTAKSYTEDQTTNCKFHKHNPWPLFTPDKAGCQKYDVPFKTNFQKDVAAGTLPKVGFISPNATNNGHDTDAQHADAFFKKWMQIIMQGPDWKGGHLAVIMTYDEAKLRVVKPGQILTTLYHPALNGAKSHVINTYIQHYSVTRLWAEVAGVWVNNPRVSIRQLKSPGNSNVEKATSMITQAGLVPDPN